MKLEQILDFDLQADQSAESLRKLARTDFKPLSQTQNPCTPPLKFVSKPSIPAARHKRT